MISNVYKPKRIRNGKQIVGRLYRGRYRLDNEIKSKEISLKTSDKQVAKERLRKIIQEQQQEAEGIISLRSVRNAANRPLLEHLEEYIADLETMGRSYEHVRHVEQRVRRLVADSCWHCPKDVTVESFLTWRSHQKNAPKTLNEFFNAISALCNWMVRRGSILSNPLKSVDRVKVKGHETVKRRAFTENEMRRLLGVAGDRKVVYLAAVCTGLRRSELAALQWGDIHLERPEPAISVRASTTKNGQAAVIPIQTELQAELRKLRPASSTAGDSVFGGRMPRMEVFKRDLRAAEIDYVNAQGQKVDFHALRKTFCTNLARYGVSPWVAMKLMRHSDIHLTTRIYTDAGLLPVGEAVQRLPHFFPMVKEDRENLESSDAPQLDPQETVFYSHSMSRSGAEWERKVVDKSPVNIEESRVLALCGTESQTSGKNGGGGIRTPVRVSVTPASTRVSGL